MLRPLPHALPAGTVSLSAKHTVNLLAGKLAGCHQVVDPGLRFGAPERQPDPSAMLRNSAFMIVSIGLFLPLFPARLHSRRAPVSQLLRRSRPL
jgi:hypothetical protein